MCVCVCVCVCVCRLLQIQLRTNCTFELQSVRQVQCTNQEQEVGVVPEQAPQLKLKGEMMPLDDQEYVAFLCSPALVAHSHSTSIPCPILCSMDSPEDLYESGIFISDLSLHNCSREFIMAGSQKHPELNIAFSQVPRNTSLSLSFPSFSSSFSLLFLLSLSSLSLSLSLPPSSTSLPSPILTLSYCTTIALANIASS